MHSGFPGGGKKNGEKTSSTKIKWTSNFTPKKRDFKNLDRKKMFRALNSYQKIEPGRKQSTVRRSRGKKSELQKPLLNNRKENKRFQLKKDSKSDINDC